MMKTMKELRKMNRYGFAHCALWLTLKAQKAYGNTDPLEIYEEEIETDEGDIIYRYSVRGVVDDDDLTETEVNELLEAMADEINAE